MSDPNLAILELVAKALGPVCDEVVFVGGCSHSRGQTAFGSRETWTSWPRRSRCTTTTPSSPACGRKVSATTCGPICRWVYKNVTLDVIPTVKEILGFANRWYPLAIATAQTVLLPSGLRIKLIAAPVFIATKLEAFNARGRDANGEPDFLGSHDMEDIVAATDRRPELLAECASMPAELGVYLASAFTRL